MRTRQLLAAIVFPSLMVFAPRVLADEPASSDDEHVVKARALYASGVELVKKAQWADALAAFEQSAALQSHATTTYNIGACERALGRYVRAKSTFLRALGQSAEAGSEMAPDIVSDAKAFVAQLDGILARVSVTLEPAEASISVDGRPLDVESSGPNPVLLAGSLPPGPGRPPPSGTFTLVLDPGPHVITLSRKGYATAVVNQSFAASAREKLALAIELLPATLRVTSTQAGALVRVDDADVGPAPVDVLRPAGLHRVVVEKKGFVPYRTQVAVQPGEEVKLRAPLLVDRPSITERWWFWAGAATVVAGGVVLTYALTRPDPQPKAYETGNSGWLVQSKSWR